MGLFDNSYPIPSTIDKPCGVEGSPHHQPYYTFESEEHGNSAATFLAVLFVHAVQESAPRCARPHLVTVNMRGKSFGMIELGVVVFFLKHWYRNYSLFDVFWPKHPKTK